MALSGDGGDELFAGYTRHRFARALAGLPAGVGRGLACGLGVAGPALWDRVFSLVPATRRPTLAGDKMLKAARHAERGRGGRLSQSRQRVGRAGEGGAQGAGAQGTDFRRSGRARAPRWARAHAISRHAHLSSRRHSHQGRSRQHGGRARSARADPRPPRRRVVLAAAVAFQDASRQGQMAAAPGALSPCAARSRRAPEDRASPFRIGDLAQRTAAAPGPRSFCPRGDWPRAGCSIPRRSSRAGASISRASATGMRRCGRC